LIHQTLHCTPFIRTACLRGQLLIITHFNLILKLHHKEEKKNAESDDTTGTDQESQQKTHKGDQASPHLIHTKFHHARRPEATGEIPLLV
jgi:hypothetical protein